MEKILVTGAGGFIGRHIVDDLLQHGYCVTGLVRDADATVLPCPVVEADLAKAIDISWHGDIIIHAAGRVPATGVTASDYKHDNIDAMENLVNFAKAKKVKLVIYLSTTDIYGRKNRKILDENTEKILDENTEYGISKYYAERLLQGNGSVSYVILRLPGILGKGAGNTWLTRAIDNMAKNNNVEVYSAEFASNNFLAVEDVAKFIRTIISNSICSNVFILGNEERIRIIDMVDFLKKEMQSQSKIIFRESYIIPFSINIAHALEYGFSSTDFQTMVRKFLTENK